MIYEVSCLSQSISRFNAPNPAERRCILLAIGNQRARPVSALKLIRRLTNRSRAWLVSGDDANLYIVKFAGHSSNPNALAHEMLWTALAAALDLPVPSVEFISVSASFLEANPSLSVGDAYGLWLRPGLHYGSRFVGEVSGPTRTVQYLLRRDVNAVSNRSDFLGMYILDVWAAREQSRKAFFLKGSETRHYRAVFVGSGDVFDSPGLSPSENKTLACHRERSLYSGLWNGEAVAYWIKAMQTKIPPAMHIIIPTIPDNWHSGNLDAIKASSLSRLNELTELIEVHSLVSD